ncbi:MAG: malonyl-ACP O-methyltransferase BioC [Rhodoferax sp.]
MDAAQPTIPRADRLQVRHAFDAAATGYDGAAQVQRAVCEALLAQLQAQCPQWAPQCALDAGCGTGYGAQLLHRAYPAAQLLRLDFAPAMLAHPAPGAPLCGDLEALPLADASLDLFWSSMAVQWCDLGRTLAEARRVLHPGGVLALSTLGPQTFAEIGAAFAQVDAHPHVITFLPPDAVQAQAQQAGLQVLALRRSRHSAWYPDLRSLLRAIKGVGAHTVPGRRSGLLGRHAWQQVQAAYESLRTSQGLPAHYDVITLLARRAGAGAA